MGCSSHPAPSAVVPHCDCVGEAEQQLGFLPRIPVRNCEAGRPPLCSPSRRPHITGPSNIKTPPSLGSTSSWVPLDCSLSLLIVGKGWSSYPPPCPAWHTLPRAEMAFLPTSSLCRPFYTHFPVPFPPKDWGGQQQSSPGSSQGRPCDWVSANEAGAGICWEGLPFPKTGPPRARPLSHLHCGSQAAPPLPGRECQDSGQKKPGLAPPSCRVGQRKPCALG